MVNDMDQTKNETDLNFLDESYTLVRTPINRTTGKPYEACEYALYPGFALAQSEPELVVLLYDSILHQHSNTGMFLYKGYGSDPLLNRKYQQRFLTKWRKIGKPTMIVTTPEDKKFFRGSLGEIPTISIYEDLIKNKVSGGCNRELYRLCEPADYGFGASLKELAEMMGVILADPSEKDPRIPFLTSSMEIRNAKKKQGLNAVHMLELVYGMGRSNTHLAHTHSENHDHDEAPQIRNTVQSPEAKAAQEALFNKECQKQNLQDLRHTLLSFFWGE